ncbi:MAG: hypothetical protein ACD_11C00024G0032 [uncultured bacterium]|nr:MAG: hypothetical protein ACD_11C00024G0032 [uncultured bacterium]HBR71956.1 hypothetical protein [Candidatus Moranbacteria bacterium]
MSESKYQWVVVPEGDFSNEAIAAELSKTCDVAGNEISFIDNKGKSRKGYIVFYEFITMLSKQISPDFKCKIFVKEGGGAFREWTLYKKKKASKKIREARKVIERLNRKKERH